MNQAGFSIEALLDAWERGLGRPAPLQALLLLSAAWPQLSLEEAGRLPVGQCDAALLELRRSLFGPQLNATSACPACGEPLELSLDIAALLEGRPATAPESLHLSQDGWELDFRLPTSADLLESPHLSAGAGWGLDPTGPAAGGGSQRARDPATQTLAGQILAQCLLSVRRDGHLQPVGAIPESLVAAVSQRMAEADPQADLRAALTCPACGHAWTAGLDIGSFLWSELGAWRQRLLWEVHRLASAYGWSQAEILALSQARRQFYLEASGE